MAKAYRTIQQWNHWLTQRLGQDLLCSEQVFLASLLTHYAGKQSLLIGVPEQKMLVDPSVLLLSPILINKNQNQNLNFIESDFTELPIYSGSVDLVVLPHTLEIMDNPRQLLSEACRIVKPQGYIVILGFNPMSLWGLKKRSGHFHSASELKQWLLFADFELVKQKMLLFRPPLTHHEWFQRLSFLEKLGAKCNLPFGGAYALVAQAKVIPLTPIRLRWKQQLSPVGAAIPRPTVRISS